MFNQKIEKNRFSAHAVNDATLMVLHERCLGGIWNFEKNGKMSFFIFAPVTSKIKTKTKQ